MKKTILIATCFLLCIGAALVFQSRQVLAADESSTATPAAAPDNSGTSQDQPIDENALFSADPKTETNNDKKNETTNNTNSGGQDQNIDENSLFSNDNTQMVQDQKVVNDNVADELQQKHIGFSGQFDASTAYNKYLYNNDWTSEGTSNQDYLTNDISADFFVDIRLNQGVKGFLSAAVDYYPTLNDQIMSQLGLAGAQSSYTNIAIKEFFIDANSNNKIYYRIGKQVLKWGQGYFWNPTDLINIERKDFSDMDKVREGTFGAKITIPNGVKSNTYFFIDMNQAQTANDVSLDGKYEFLIGGTEMSVSARLQNGVAPYYGFDITGRLGDFDYRGEMSLTDGSNYQVLNYDTLGVETLSGLIPQVCFGLTKSFDNGDIKDRISLTGEFYYNQAGYDKNMVQRIAETIADEPNPDNRKILRQYLLPYYQFYSSGKYYVALFSSVSKFLISDMTLNVNGITNLVDHSATLTAGVTYQPTLSDISYKANITGNFGDRFTEANASGVSCSFSLGATIKF